MTTAQASPPLSLLEELTAEARSLGLADLPEVVQAKERISRAEAFGSRAGAALARRVETATLEALLGNPATSAGGSLIPHPEGTAGNGMDERFSVSVLNARSPLASMSS